nr:nickel pincer cofactor biosynthesis protein LarC [uncultured Blautia sp.]
MKNKLYLECTSGISGDMAVAALLDLGASREKLKKVLKSLPVKGFDIKISRVVKSGIDACDFDVVLDKEHENHDHDMGYLHGHEHSHEHEEAHACRANHHHETTGHVHEHCGLNEIMTIIDHADMADRARSYAKKIFTILAEAEAKAHNVPADQVHFHEVGAVDSIVDILSVAVCMDDLDVEEVIIPRLCEGSGTIRCQHGILPVPVPAVSNIVSAHHLKLHITPVQGELVTPTGAAIAAAFITSEKLPEDFTVEKLGIGAGKRQYECPGILRAMLIREAEKNTEIQKFSDTESDIIIKLESNIDDCSGETLGYVMELLYEAGAREANYMPVFMKKNRPAWLLTVICKEDQVSGMERIIFKETTTIGIRRQKMERTVLKREKRTVVTPLGDVEVKVCIFDGQEYIYPEYESVKKICKKTGVSYREAYHMTVCG